MKELRERFFNRNQRELLKTKTPLNQLPLQFAYGSSSHNPDIKNEIETSDFVMWVRLGNEWFRPTNSFSEEQIVSMVEICDNDKQVIELFEMLCAK